MVVQSKSIVLMVEQYPGRQWVTWKVMSKSLLQPPSPSTTSDSYLPTSLALFLPPPPTPTTPFLGSADLVHEVFSIEVGGAAIWLNLDEPPWWIQKSPECLVLTLVQVRASRWIRPTLKAYGFLMVKLLEFQTYSQRDPLDFWSRKMGKDGSTCGWLGWSSTSSIAWSLILVCSGNLKPSPKRTQSWHTRRWPL